jgi:xylitol oxidase
MKKRAFLKTTGAIAAGTVFNPYSFCTVPENKTMPATNQETRWNWAGNLQYSAVNFYQPSTISEIQEVVRQCDHLSTLGTAHCFNTIADSKYNQLSVRGLDQMLEVDAERSMVIVGAGTSYGQICTELYDQGFALHNLASLPHISVAGAIATATHGSGIKNGNLGSAVSAIEFIDASGELQHLSRKKDPDVFGGIITHLGGLGVLTKITLDLQPGFKVKQEVYQYLPVKKLLENFTEIMSGGYSVSLFTDYQTDTVNQVWVKSKADGSKPDTPSDYFGAVPASRNLHPIVELSAENCTDQMGVPGPWYDRLPHFKMDFMPSSGKELQSEFFVPLKKAPEAFEVISALKHEIEPVLMISEIRAIAADNQWMSPCYQQDSVTFHFTWEQDREGVERVLSMIQDGLEPFKVRPHWGKVFTMRPERLHSLYPNLDKFKAVLAKYDPNGKFRNEFLGQYLY